MNYEYLLDLVLRLNVPEELWYVGIASLLGLMLGLERAFKGKAASIRTFALLAGGSALFTILSTLAAPSLGSEGVVDHSRIAAQIVSGLGFLGAGVIFRYQDRLSGITTAVMIWFTAAVGMACGFRQVGLAVGSVTIYYVILIVGEFFHRIAGTKRAQDDDD